MGINFQMLTYQKYFWMSPANSGLCSCFCTRPPLTSALLFCFSVLCLRLMERVLLKMLRSNLILYILQGRSRSFLYNSIKGFCTLLNSTVYSSLSFFFALLLLLLCLFVNFFQTSEQGIFWCRIFCFWTRQMACAISRNQTVKLF